MNRGDIDYRLKDFDCGDELTVRKKKIGQAKTTNSVVDQSNYKTCTYIEEYSIERGGNGACVHIVLQLDWSTVELVDLVQLTNFQRVMTHEIMVTHCHLKFGILTTSQSRFTISTMNKLDGWFHMILQ